jgi:WD40 repeat protein
MAVVAESDGSSNNETIALDLLAGTELRKHRFDNYGPLWVGEINGRWLLVLKGSRSTVATYEVDSGERVGESLRIQRVEISCIGLVDARAVLVTVRLRRWQSDTGKELSEDFAELAQDLRQGWDFQLIRQERIAQVWDLNHGTLLAERTLTHQEDSISGATVSVIDDQPVLICVDSGLYLSLFSLPDLSPMSRHRLGGEGYVTATAFGSVRGRQAVACSSNLGIVQVWDCTTGAVIGKPAAGHEFGATAIALASLNNTSIVLTGGNDGLIRIFDLFQGDFIGEPLVGHDLSITALAGCELQDRPAIISGSRDDTIRVWDPADAMEVGVQPQQLEALVSSAVVGDLHGQSIVMSGGSDGTVRIWDLLSGTPVGRPMRRHVGPVTSVALGHWTGRSIGVSGGDDGKVVVWDLSTSQSLRTFVAEAFIRSVVVASLRDHSVIITRSGVSGKVEVWDLDSGLPVQDKRVPMYSLSMSEYQGSPVIVSNSNRYQLLIRDAVTSRLLVAPLERKRRRGAVQAVLEVDGKPAIVSETNGHKLLLWNPADGSIITHIETRHEGDISAVAVGQLHGNPVIVSGSSDQTVRICSLEKGSEMIIETDSAIRGLIIVPEDTVIVDSNRGLMVVQILESVANGRSD